MTESNNFFKRPTLPPLPPNKSSDGPISIPKNIGPYSIETLLEKGGMSLLYLGTHPETHDPITIKVLSPKYLSHPEMTQRFLNEAEIIAMADHPNIVKLYGYGEWEGGLYIAMEFIQGVSLRQYLMQNPLSLKRALEITLEISYALCHLHTHGVIHRDLKPENILINEAGHVKVIDFGIAQLISPQEKSLDGEHKKRLLGTPVYMSPEQIKNPESVSYPSDIYSLGIITYELVLGKLSHGKIHLSLMPKGLQKILAKALQTSLTDRYQDIVDFISDLSSYLHSSNLERERKASDQVGEIFEKLQELQFKITCREPPFLPFAEIGLIQHRPTGLSSVFCDFFPLPDERFGILLAESSQPGAEGLMYLSYLKGLLQGIDADHRSDIAVFISLLNRLLVNANIEHIFTCCYVILNPKQRQFSFISCGFGPLWILSKDRYTSLGSSNIALGIDEDFPFQSQTKPWNPEEMILLCSTSSLGASVEQFEQFLTDSWQPSAQKLIDTILRKAKSNNPKHLEEHSCMMISIMSKDDSTN